MKLFGGFKKKKKKSEEKNIQTKKIEAKKPEVKAKKTIGRESEKVSLQKEKKKFEEVQLILKAPHITEKATELNKEKFYLFKVIPKANKIEIKKAVESLYKVKVEKVRIVWIPKKKKGRASLTGFKKGYKKAIVKLKPGQKIEIMSR